MRQFTIILGLLTALALAPAASASDRGALAATAEHPDGSSVRVFASDAPANGVCLDIEAAGQGGHDAACMPPSTTAATAVRGVRLARFTGSTPATVAFGAVTGRTRTLEITFDRGRAVRVPAAPALEYTGAQASTARFYAVAVAGSRSVAAVRAFDASGRALAAADVSPMLLPARRGSAVLTQLQDEHNAPSSLVALDTRILSPTRSDVDRRVRALCVGLKTRQAPPVGRAVCIRKDSQVEVRFAGDCAQGRVLMYGVLPSLVRRAVAVLDNGQRRTVRLFKLPRYLGHRSKGLLLQQPGTVGFRALDAYSRTGRKLATVRLNGDSIC